MSSGFIDWLMRSLSTDGKEARVCTMVLRCDINQQKLLIPTILLNRSYVYY